MEPVVQTTLTEADYRNSSVPAGVGQEAALGVPGGGMHVARTEAEALLREHHAGWI